MTLRIQGEIAEVFTRNGKKIVGIVSPGEADESGVSLEYIMSSSGFYVSAGVVFALKRPRE